MHSIDQGNTERKRRPDLLTILCILSFVGSGLAAFSNLVLFLTYDEMDIMLEELKLEMDEIRLLLSGGKSFFVSGFFLYAISLAGVTAMWKLRKVGFHLYTASQVFLLILPVVSIEDFPFSIAGLLLTASFILGYATQLKFMK